MRTVKFIHCADLHLGSPFKGISSGNPALGAALAAATFDAFANIIDAALDHDADFLLIAGDVFDAEDHSLRSRLFFKNRLERLEEAGIRCFIVCGNHDPLRSWSQTVGLPDNTVIFDAGVPQTFTVERHGHELATICGTSFETGAVTANLAARFKRERSDLPAVALLHAAVNSAGGNDYAPAQLSDLTGLTQNNFDYWALGHAHSFAILNPAFPAVVYPGCPQGTSPRETGAKSCCLVQLQPGSAPQIEALAVDMIRYAFRELNITGMETFEDLFAAVNEAGEKIIVENGGRKTVLRLKLSGRSRLNRELRAEDKNNELTEHFEKELGALGETLFLNRVELATREDYNPETFSRGSGFIADLLAGADTLLTDPAGATGVVAELEPIYRKCRALPPFSVEELRAIVENAKYLALDQLLGDGGT
ncbi:MAG: DNA repair exonuclease [Victivallaceae bacterium]|nr:DNA repair exonuclease [Victivallaceae bacterium]